MSVHAVAACFSLILGVEGAHAQAGQTSKDPAADPEVATAPETQADPHAEARAALGEELRERAYRETWGAAERTWQALVELDRARGVPVPYEDLMIGARVARELGELTETYRRLEQAKALRDTATVKEWLGALDDAFGWVVLATDPAYDAPVALRVLGEPVQADARSVVEEAQAEVGVRRAFMGMLPVGRYAFGGQVFDVLPGGSRVEVYLEQAGSGPRPETGLRLDLGTGWAALSSPSSGARGTQPGPLDGVGIRFGVGLEHELRPNLRLMGQVGYHGILPSRATVTDSPGDELVQKPVGDDFKEFLHLGWLWAGVTWTRSDLALTTGPIVGTGSARVQGIHGERLATDAQTPVTGDIRAAGGALSAFYGLFDTPGLSGSRGGVSAHTGVLGDRSRLYPWAQLAFTIAPDTR